MGLKDYNLPGHAHHRDCGPRPISSRRARESSIFAPHHRFYFPALPGPAPVEPVLFALHRATSGRDLEPGHELSSRHSFLIPSGLFQPEPVVTHSHVRIRGLIPLLRFSYLFYTTAGLLCDIL